MTKHEAASSSRTTTNLKSAWQTSTLLLALALALLGAQSAAAATTSVSVSAFIRPTATLSVDAQPGSVIVTADDVRRGYVDLPASSRVRVRTNSPNGYALVLEVESTEFDAVVLEESGQRVEIRGSGFVDRPFRGRSEVVSELGYRLLLTSATQPGVYAWPVAVSAQPR
jgi:hypothetical protein